MTLAFAIRTFVSKKSQRKILVATLKMSISFKQQRILGYAKIILLYSVLV